jgi:SpoVK/Ycf46/Vps4 family AAA+-type ATPase
MDALIKTIEDKLLSSSTIPEINTLADLINAAETCSHPDILSVRCVLKELRQLNSMIGMTELKENIIYQILYFLQRFHSTSMDYMHTVIYGPPGTGKTEIAKIIGTMYSKLGILKKNIFKKVVREQLVAGYLGQTAIKTKEVIESCLGGVLFIDEAYALGNSEKTDSFSKECIDTLCDALSEHRSEFMVIIAGYERELNECFFKYNQGLESRFVWHFKTDEYTASDLYHIFIKMIRDIEWKYTFYESDEKNIQWFQKNKEYFKFMGRDIENLLTKVKICHSKRVFGKNGEEKKHLTLSDLEKGMTLFLSNNNVKKRKEESYGNQQLQYSMYL